MKHAICVIGYGSDAKVFQKTIDILDSSDIDFFIHWDKKFKLPKLHSHNSNINFIKNRIAVNWGSDSQIKATLLLLKKVNKQNKYDCVHLISSMDIPLMTKDYFVEYFKNDVYLGFDEKFTYRDAISRIGYFYPNIDFRRHRHIANFIRRCNKILGINRIRNQSVINKGPNWFSIKSQYVDEILNSNLSMFMHSCCADEIIVQTILKRFKDKQIKTKSDNKQALRYIDWQKGNPYVFTIEDAKNLRSKINTNFAFARKVEDPNVVDKIF